MSVTTVSNSKRNGRTILQARVVREQERDACAPRSGEVEPETRTQWQSIEVRHLAALAVVARLGSFRRAAEELGYVQSAISSQIAHLEQAVGTRLLERASGTPLVELTPAGQVLLRHTDEILARFENAYADISSLANRTAGVVRVAGLELLAPRQVAEILSLFRQRYPFARVQIAPAVARAAGVAQLGEGTLDLLVCEPLAINRILTQEPLQRDEYVLVVPADSELVRCAEPLTARRLSELRPIVPRSCPGADALAVRLRGLGVEPHPRLSPESASTAQALVAQRIGTALVPAKLVEGRAGVATISLAHLLAPHMIVLAFDTEPARSAAVDGFIAAIREICDATECEAAADTQPERGQTPQAA
jgi:DNA-binding transcriptional LysR family regulator